MKWRRQLKHSGRTAAHGLRALPEDARRALRFMALMDRMKNGESMLLMPF